LFASCSVLAKIVSKVLYVFISTVPQFSVSIIFVTESRMDLLFFKLIMSNGINIRVTGWHAVEFEKLVHLGESSIIVSVVSFWWTLL